MTANYGKRTMLRVRRTSCGQSAGRPPETLRKTRGHFAERRALKVVKEVTVVKKTYNPFLPSTSTLDGKEGTK